MAELPTGTVTFLFTDLEGSTRLWEENADPMKGAMVRHDAILRGAIVAHDGYIVKMTGDGVHAAFATAPDAIDAAVDAQRALVDEDWGEPGVLRVRMGLHTGAADVRDGDYYGTAVNKAARLMSAAHGGQILVSHATEEVARDAVDGDFELLDLGEHRLRDLSRAEHVYQIVADGLPYGFPSLRSLDEFPANLPVQLTSFVGRERELRALVERVQANRLVTITGVGGVGKTRLATQVAGELLPSFADGTWFCDLAGADDENGVVSIVASTIGARPQPSRPLAATILEFLRPRRVLLLLDNCEHLLDAAGDFAAGVLGGCPNVHVLMTSREALGVPGERMWALKSLDVPGEGAALDELRAVESIRLFVSRADAVRADFELDAGNAQASAEICRRLDGIPLAIELAAARVVAIRPAEIASLLDERFRFLTGSRRRAVERHQTLRAAVDWSYSLLDSTERAVFERLGVFAGTFSRDAAAAVASDDTLDQWAVTESLASLVAKSMLVDEECFDGTTRYRMLETLRQYAQERLEEHGVADTWRRRHAAYFATFAEEAGGLFSGPDELLWARKIALEDENLRAVLGWALDRTDQDDADLALRIIVDLSDLYTSGISLWEWAERAVARAEHATTGVRTAVLGEAAMYLVLDRGDVDGARARALDALRFGMPSDCPIPEGAYNALSMCALVQGDTDEAMRWVRELGELLEGFEPQPGSYRRARLVPGVHTMATSVAVAAHDWDTAQRDADAAVELSRGLGPSARAYGMFARGLAYERDDPALALRAFEEAAELMRLGGRSDNNFGYCMAAIARLRRRNGDVSGALDALHDGIAHYQAIGIRPELSSVIVESVTTLSRSGFDHQAATITGIMHGPLSALGYHVGNARSERVLASARERLLGAGYGQLLAEGEAVGYDDALESTLRSLDAAVEAYGVAVP